MEEFADLQVIAVCPSHCGFNRRTTLPSTRIGERYFTTQTLPHLFQGILILVLDENGVHWEGYDQERGHGEMLVQPPLGFLIAKK
jgi:hypothetical protein